MESLSFFTDLGLTRTEKSSPLRVWAPWGRGRVLPSESELLRTGAVPWPPSAWGKGLWDQRPSPPAGGGAPLRPCPLCDMLEVSGDQDTQGWVQGAAQGVVTRGLLRAAGAEDGAEVSCEAVGH